MKIKTKNWSKF